MARITEVDALRGIAIVLMVVYHIIFDLSYFGVMQINIFDLPLVLFQRFIGTLFILLAGVSLTLSESKNKEGYLHHVKRGLKLAGIALLITLATWIYPHEEFITFGIIHFIALATLIAPFFFRFGRVNVVLGALIILAGFFITSINTDSHFLFWLGLTYPGYEALDFYPMIPWFGVVLLGIYAGSSLFQNGERGVKTSQSSLMDKLAFLGRNSLVIYLIHQPVLICIMVAFKMLT